MKTSEYRINWYLGTLKRRCSTCNLAGCRCDGLRRVVWTSHLKDDRLRVEIINLIPLWCSLTTGRLDPLFAFSSHRQKDRYVGKERKEWPGLVSVSQSPMLDSHFQLMPHLVLVWRHESRHNDDQDSHFPTWHPETACYRITRLLYFTSPAVWLISAGFVI